MKNSVISAQETFEQINHSESAIYIDVRTVAEFIEGHPKGKVINIPIVFYHPKTGDTHPNDAFTLVANHGLSHEDAIIIGADDSDRATVAAKSLDEAGFSNISVMEEGLPGWRKQELPVTGDNRPGVSYVSLLTPARRAKPNKS
jgi:rhodanese-related sulfurtransferase